MDLVSMRQKLVASNIANADTPGYTTQDLDFQTAFKSVLDGGTPEPVAVSGLTVKNDGNNVDLDREVEASGGECPPFQHRFQFDERTDHPGKRGNQGRRLMSLFSSLSVSASGMAAQRTRAALLVENIANAETTRTPEGGPYRRKDAVFSTMPVSSEFASELQSQLQTGVTVSDISVDQTPPEKMYMPGHPDADADGYVNVPRINSAEDMVDLTSANRSYQANVSAISAVKDMIQKSIDLLR